MTTDCLTWPWWMPEKWALPEARFLKRPFWKRRDAVEKIDLLIPAGQAQLEATLYLPRNPRGVVVFSNGHGNSRYNPRNNFLADTMGRNGIACLLSDLLHDGESPNPESVDLLCERLLHSMAWVRSCADVNGVPVGLLGAGRGSAAAVRAAAIRPGKVAALVSRGGYLDPAREYLSMVDSPTLLIVGGEDHGILEMNRAACARLRCRKDFAVIPEAGHRFEEPGAMEKVAGLAVDWFSGCFGSKAGDTGGRWMRNRLGIHWPELAESTG